MTVAESQTLLSRYAGVGNTYLERLNLVRARLLEDGSWPGMTPTIGLRVYTDADGRSIVTLPRQFLAILRGRIESSETATESGTICGGTFDFATADLSGLPTSDPHVVGRAWSNGGVLMISEG